MIARVGQTVLYRTHGDFDFAAIVVATENPVGFGLPELPKGNVHLRVFVPPFGVPEIANDTLGTPYASFLDGITKGKESIRGTWRPLDDLED